MSLSSPSPGHLLSRFCNFKRWSHQCQDQAFNLFCFRKQNKSFKFRSSPPQFFLSKQPRICPHVPSQMMTHYCQIPFPYKSVTALPSLEMSRDQEFRGPTNWAESGLCLPLTQWQDPFLYHVVSRLKDGMFQNLKKSRPQSWWPDWHFQQRLPRF